MAETYIQMFEEEFYPEIFAIMADKCIQRFTEQKEQIADDWKKELKQHMAQLIQKQKLGQAGAILEMNISFLFTSLNEKPVFRIDSYEEEGRIFAESVLTGYVRADWLVLELDKMGELLLEKAREEKLQRYIRAAEIETLKLRAVKSLLYYFALRFKYMVPEFLDMKSLAGVKKTPIFVLQMGEYMDWQKTIYAILPEVDIFNCDEKTDLRFRNFPAIFYQKKKFQNLNLSQSKFQDCTFSDSILADMKMNDCTFDGCVFENVKFINTQMVGSLFIRCTFRRTEFENVEFIKDGTEEEEPDYFEPAEFYECEFINSQFKKCKLEGCFTTDCDGKELKMVACMADDSGFIEMENIIWKQDEEE